MRTDYDQLERRLLCLLAGALAGTDDTDVATRRAPAVGAGGGLPV